MHAQEQNFGTIWQPYFQFFKESAHCFPQWLHQSTFSPTITTVLFSLHLLQYLLFVDFLVMANLTSVGCHLIVAFICISLIISHFEHSFHVPISHLYVFFEEMSIQVFCPFFDWVICFWVLSCMSCLYILEINPLLVASFTNIFSHSMGYLFVLFMVSFAVQKLLSLIRSHLFLCFCQFSSVQLLSCVRLCDPLDCSTAGLPVHHRLPEFAQTHVH